MHFLLLRRSLRRPLLLLVGLSLLSWVSKANAYKRIFTPGGAAVKWQSTPVGWSYNHNNFQQISQQQMLQVLQASFSKWESPNCSALVFAYKGATGSIWNQNDSSNVLIWNSQIPDPNFPTALALTIPTYVNATGAYTDADIIYNASYPWSANPTSQQYDVVGTSTHEIGHLLGLDHTQVASATMFPTASPGVCSCRTLKQDDIDGVCAIYPSGQQGSGNRQYGQSCDAQNLCATGLTCVLLQQGATTGVCFRRCTNGVCPTGDTCYPLSNGEDACLCTSNSDCNQQGQTCTQSQCSNGGGNPTNTKKLGEVCDAQNLCVQGLTCVVTQQGSTTGVCHNTCPNDTCSDGNKCYPLNNGEKACLCLSDQDCNGQSCQANFCQGSNTGPAGKEGEACGPGGKCEAGLTCVQDPNSSQSLCVRPCQSNNDCQNGWVCNSQYNICIPGAGTQQRGEICDNQDRCSNGLVCTLVQQGAQSGICIQVCNAQGQCPGGETCLQAQGGQKLCMCGKEYPCPQGKVCNDDFECVNGNNPGCQSNADCAAGQVCQSGRCVAAPQCQSAGDCGAGQICQNGSCIPDPSICQRDANCPPGQTCAQGRCVPDNTSGCQSNADCGAGQQCSNGACVNSPTDAGNNSACDPPCESNSVCNNGSCIFARRCETSLECGISEDCITGFCRPIETPPDKVNPPPDDTACGCTATQSPAWGGWLLLLLAFPLVIRRRRRV
ncbi:MAG: matrixin family metalloprotease [Deltaproteobacteria bacterium]|nr:MAG: matrixin family metalloprotease [Deltaproteobacteria bacterium]